MIAERGSPTSDKRHAFNAGIARRMQALCSQAKA